MATNPKMEVRTGVAQGEATKAEEPPRRKVRIKEPCSLLFAPFEIIFPLPSIKIVPSLTTLAREVGIGLSFRRGRLIKSNS